ncbi:EexN family lipoprotein [Campylobacter sp. B0100352/1]|uniref:EexN family lipoprotein n=1 Tax=Campylobacter sp. B0100352/1 TaxID=2735783 RepID=UPI001DEC7772|nr:EexN family lipoprotein [Campylobacter sp. B0100352/1]
MKNIFFGLIMGINALIILAGCGEEAKTKEYYETHIEEAKTKAAECKKLERFNETQRLDCENANEALLNRRTIKNF